jgi:hypothetical protein
MDSIPPRTTTPRITIGWQTCGFRTNGSFSHRSLVVRGEANYRSVGLDACLYVLVIQPLCRAGPGRAGLVRCVRWAPSAAGRQLAYLFPAKAFEIQAEKREYCLNFWSLQASPVPPFQNNKSPGRHRPGGGDARFESTSDGVASVLAIASDRLVIPIHGME